MALFAISDCVRILKDCKLPKSNITKGEKTALRDLKADPSILVLPADKGRATVVLNKETYVEKASELLSDSNTYKTLKRDPTPTYRNQLVQVLQSLRDSGAIDVPTYRRLYPTSSDVPKFYGLPKIHKAACPLRPIVSSCGSLTYNSAKFVADLLAPLVGKSDRHLKNSANLVDKLSGVIVGEDECLVSYDVTALFTSVPVVESVNIIHDLLTSDTTLFARTKLTPQQITDLLTVCLKTTYFVHDGQFYSQCEGAAMGSPVSPIIANLFMEHLETLALSSFHSPPTFYGRYVDDTMVILKRSVVEDFTNHLNSVHPAIKFTVEFEQANKIAMLDTLISRNADGSLAFILKPGLSCTVNTQSKKMRKGGPQEYRGKRGANWRKKQETEEKSRGRKIGKRKKGVSYAWINIDKNLTSDKCGQLNEQEDASF
ncbi:uncharacterized protein [Amphiura filiformis]|uniref:uncharacterized protein n=1 Tax=Amphiura filiformis TaxID=82378 RepID=UPI003B2102D1